MIIETIVEYLKQKYNPDEIHYYEHYPGFNNGSIRIKMLFPCWIIFKNTQKYNWGFKYLNPADPELFTELDSIVKHITKYRYTEYDT